MSLVHSTSGHLKKHAYQVLSQSIVTELVSRLTGRQHRLEKKPIYVDFFKATLRVDYTKSGK
jgi:hypothetical protein